jgi:LuxR family maltose regulon positive regulatory protein
MLAKGELQVALGSLAEGNQLISNNMVPPSSQIRLASCGVEVSIAVGYIASAERWADKAPTGPDTCPFYRNLYLTPIRMKLALGETAAAYALLNEASKVAEEAGWQYGLVALRVMQALAAPGQDAAVGFLQHALEIAFPERFFRTFVDAGEPLVPLLKECARRGVYPEYTGEILAAIEVGLMLPPGIEPLSERELEVLHLVAAGLSNQKIAEQLVVSISTVKSHVHHISSKLGAANRIEAVNSARKFGIL